ncbi:hypothetical protein [Celerinatantimonas diazotrophica]|nr:hypothetical protein [Celerinatantimonas diazotrophica]
MMTHDMMTTLSDAGRLILKFPALQQEDQQKTSSTEAVLHFAGGVSYKPNKVRLALSLADQIYLSEAAI